MAAIGAIVSYSLDVGPRRGEGRPSVVVGATGPILDLVVFTRPGDFSNPAEVGFVLWRPAVSRGTTEGKWS